MTSSALGDFYSSEFKWKIKVDELSSKKKGEFILTPKFHDNDTINNMRLCLYPKGQKDSPNDNLGLFLYNYNYHNVTLNCSISLLNNDDEKIKKRKYKNATIEPRNKLGWPNFIKDTFMLDPANKLIKDGKITIVLNFHEDCESGENKNKNDLKDMTEKLFTNKKYSDVTIKCGRNKYHLHKCILASRSSVFAAMFDTDMMEKEKNIVTITDINPKVLQQFFKYLYTNTVDNFEEIAKDLLIVSDKYLVTGLKDDCEETMCHNINVVNALEYLKIAELHNVKKLKSKLINFMASNITKFFNNSEFKLLSQEQLLEIMSHHVYLSKKK